MDSFMGEPRKMGFGILTEWIECMKGIALIGFK